MIDVSDEISISSTNEDDTIHHLVIDQRMDINEIVDFIDMNCHEQTSTP